MAILSSTILADIYKTQINLDLVWLYYKNHLLEMHWQHMNVLCFHNSTTTTSTNNTSSQLCFQNLSYERNSTSVYSQSPPPDGAIYDLPFQQPTGTLKGEKPQNTKTMEMFVNNRYKSTDETIHHGMLGRPTVYDNDYWGDEQQMGPIPVTEYEVPIQQKWSRMQSMTPWL